MIAELGQFALVLALCLAVVLSILPAAGVVMNNRVWMQTAPGIAAGIFVFIGVALVALAYAFLNDDFSVSYVARNSNTALPDQYKISAIWGAHEGSFLLWTFIMAGWTLAVAFFSNSLTLDMRARVLAVMGLLSTGFLMFLLLTSNPFDRSLPIIPAQGGDLNPLLQDIGLILHPPMLYMGYVGLSVPFAFAIASLTTGQLDTVWARWSRPWTNAAWGFLTIGITLGSWWAYYELGWGGWWFWDAVENASFMPWLVATALVHSLAVTEKRGVFKSWTVLLAIFAFSLSLLGAFLVRSGVLTSVHSFAVDPERGLFILAFLVLVVGGSLLLYAIKAAGIKSSSGFDYTGRESFLLVNNLLLVVAAGVVLLGTLYPLLYEVMTDGRKISVGPPYFNTVFVPLSLVLFAVMALSPLSRWRSSDLNAMLKVELPMALGAALLSLVILLLFASFEWMVWFANAMAFWVCISVVYDSWLRVRYKTNKLLSVFGQPASIYGMWFAHIGIAVSILGIGSVQYFSEERDVRMSAGDVVTLSGYEFTFESIGKVEGPNYIADRGVIQVSSDGKQLTTLYPEKRLYRATGNVMTEADMDPGLFRDLYVALGEPVNNQGAWAVRVHYKPMVRWVWAGGLFIAFGGFLTLWDRRYRQARKRAVSASDAQASAV